MLSKKVASQRLWCGGQFVSSIGGWNGWSALSVGGRGDGRLGLKMAKFRFFWVRVQAEATKVLPWKRPRIKTQTKFENWQERTAVQSHVWWTRQYGSFSCSFRVLYFYTSFFISLLRGRCIIVVM